MTMPPGSNNKNRNTVSNATTIGGNPLQPQAQLVIGQSNQTATATAVIPTAPAGALLFNSVYL